MSWFKNFKESTGLRVQTLKTGQRLPPPIVFLVLVLDIYLISVLFQGIGWTSQKIQSPSEKISPVLTGLTSNPSSLWPNSLTVAEPDRSGRVWGLNGDYPRLGTFIQYGEGSLSYSQYNYSPYGGYHNRRTDSGLGSAKVAKEAKERFDSEWNSPLAQEWVRKMRSLQQTITQIDGEIRGLVSNYDTMLRERSARLSPDKSLMPTTADEVQKRIMAKRVELEKAVYSWNTTSRSLLSLAALQEYLISIRGEVAQIVESSRRWHAFTVNFWQVAFVLPILVLAIFWHRRNMRRTDAEVGVLVSSHMIYVASVPIIWKVLVLVNYILPYRILADLFRYFWEAGLQYLWSYILVGIGVGIIFAMARWVLKHSKKTKAVHYLKCLEMGLCPRTARRLPPGCRYSPYTGDALKVQTEAGESYRYAPFDSQSGKPNPEWEELTK